MNVIDIQKEKEYLAKVHGIKTFQELKEAAKKLRLNIGVFVTPLPPTAKAVK